MNLDRRSFIKKTGATLGAMKLASFTTLPAATPNREPGASVRSGVSGLPVEWRKMRKLDAHNHVFAPVHRPNADWSDVESLVEAAEVLGIEKLFCSHPITAGVLVEISTVRDANDSVLAAMKRYPRTIAGYCFVQPGNGKAALEEIDRCLDAGMIGVKLYNQFKFSDPVLYPVAEKCIKHRIPFLGHSAHLTDPRTLAAQLNTSDSLEFCALSRRFPELLLIMGHVGGGGDWEWAIKGLRDCPNVFVDTSGTVLEDGLIEQCVKVLGHERLLFATDMTMEGGVGKILSANLSPPQREDIFWRNFQRILDRRKT